MSAAAKLGTVQTSQAVRLDPADLLTPAELAARLKVSKSWVFEQTRQRSKIRNEKPLPHIRLGKYLRFSWIQVSEWLMEQSH